MTKLQFVAKYNTEVCDLSALAPAVYTLYTYFGDSQEAKNTKLDKTMSYDF